MENNQNKKYWFFGSKLNTGLLLVLIVLMVIALMWMKKDEGKYFNFFDKGDEQKVEQEEEKDTEKEVVKPQVKDTYTYTNHGFSIELPKGFVPKEDEIGPELDMNLPVGYLVYVTDINTWERNVISASVFSKEEKIGETIFKVYENKNINSTSYWFRKGNVGYWFVNADVKQLESFKFVGWPQMEGNTEDLTSFSIKPGQEVSGKVKVTGVLPARYFFEATCGISILDSNKKLVKNFLCQSSDQDWMERKTTNFYSDLDFTNLPKGNAYIKVEQDDPRGESGMGEYTVRSVLVPIVIK